MDLWKGLLLAGLVVFAARCASAGAGTPGSAQAANGCEIDAAKICDEGKDLHDTRNTGEADTQSQREQNFSPTQSWTYTFETPDKTTLQVSCELNIRHHKVIYAHALRGPTLTESDVSYLKSQGLCVEQK